MRRELVSDDGVTRTFVVYDDDGNEIGSDVEAITPSDPAPVDITPAIDADTAAAVNAQVQKATTIAGIKAAFAQLLDALGPS
jgi:hypothetical protein